MPHIDYFFATISPFTYLAGDGLETVAEKHGATIAYKPIDIMALFARTGGTPPPQRHESRQIYRLQDMARRAKHLGKPLNLKPAHWPTNPAPSSYAIIAAANAGGGDLAGLVQSFPKACWEEDLDVAQDDVIRSKLEAAGFDPSLADSGLLTGAETYAANLEEAVTKGAFGAPFYIVGDERFWGQDRLADLDAHLAELT